jgi:hypothetical protein
MKRLAAFGSKASMLGAVIVLALSQGSTAAGAEAITVEPGIFDPGNTGTVAAAWIKHLGEPDPGDIGDVDRFGLILSKNTVTPTNSAAVATVENVRGLHLTEIGFDFKNGSHCGAGAPRFDVVTTDAVLHFVGGCGNGTITPNTPEAGWSRVRFDLTTASFPPIASTDTVKLIQIVFDEGTDTGTDFSGQAVIDNIDINGTLIGAPEGSL